MSKDTRKHERLESLFSIDINSSITKETMGRGVVTNISVGGFMLETEATLKKGNRYEGMFEVPMCFVGEVMWEKSKGAIRQYGIKFTGLSLLDKFIMKKILKGPRRNKHT